MQIVFGLLGGLWASPMGRTLLIGSGLFVWGLWKGWAWAAAGRDAAIERAIAGRDIYWQQTIQKANDEHESEMRKAIEAARHIPAARTRDELVQLCRDPQGRADCREADSNRMQGVQSNQVVR